MKFRDTSSQQGAELELAPMIDVVFLLLIFFIVTWQFARFERDMDISVPAAEEAENMDRQQGEIIVNVREDGSIVLNGRVVSEDELLSKLQSISEAYPDQAVILRGSSEANFQAIINVLDQIKKAGIWNVAFATTKPQE
ncbi:MAG: biopolymer transporter ExbD [Verrucomicrobiales bacterium]|nr:biopolymer transporter ExbD [Verrucomicrobiales bacterium]